MNHTKLILPVSDDSITPDSPDLSWGVKMLLLFLLLFCSMYFLFYIFSQSIVSYISLEDEHNLFGDTLLQEDARVFDFEILTTYRGGEDQIYPVYIQSMGVANAFATLGGNIILTTELLEELEYEEELLFIIGHEAEHIEKRHVLTGLLTNIPFKMTLVLLGFEFDTSFISKKTTQFFDKNLETKADQGGIDFLNEINLNLECALGFFSRESPSLLNSYFEFDSSHPITQNRIKHIQQAAEISANYQDCHTLVYE